MSHISKQSVLVRNLEALEIAVTNLGGVFKKGQTHHKYYYGQADCLHAFGIKDNKKAYEVGVIWDAKNQCYDLAYDSFMEGSSGLAGVFGRNLINLKKEYAAVQSEMQLAEEGFETYRTINEDGTIVVSGTRMVETY